MSPRVVRWAVLVVFVAGIAGMIATSVAGSSDGALAFGLATAAATVVLLAVTAVTTPPGGGNDEAVAERLEGRVQALVAGGADEADVRRLVADAVALGRRRSVDR
jgi:uncharacterized membrane protein YjjP (DUF1212 family)